MAGQEPRFMQTLELKPEPWKIPLGSPREVNEGGPPPRDYNLIAVVGPRLVDIFIVPGCFLLCRQD